MEHVLSLQGISLDSHISKKAFYCLDPFSLKSGKLAIIGGQVNFNAHLVYLIKPSMQPQAVSCFIIHGHGG